MTFYFFHTGQVLSSTGLVCAKFKCISTKLQQHILSWGSPVNHWGMVSVSCFFVGSSRQMSIVKFNRFSFPLWISYCNPKKSCYHTFNVQLYSILCHMNVDITTSITVTLWLHIWVWFGSYEISNSKGIWVRDHQHRAIGGQLKEVRSSQNHWCQMAIEIGLVIIKHVTIETFGHFWLLLGTWQLKLLIAFGCWLYSWRVGDHNFSIPFNF